MKSELLELLTKGKVKSETDSEDYAIDLLKKAAASKPELLFESILEAIKIDSPMVMIGLAAFISGTSPDTINIKVASELHNLLLSYESPDLLLLTELLKGKVFGRGLGSKPQKIIRKVLEAWTDSDLKNQIVAYPQELICLMKIIHPKFQDPIRSQLVLNLFSIK